jgi:hypothetical protein
MSILNKTNLLADITSNIYTNVTRLIKGNTLKARLLNIVDSTLIRVVDTAANFTANNPVLKDGEVGIESDSLLTSPKFKLGNGVAAWNSLPYITNQTIVDTAANFTANNPILNTGQLGVETDDLLTVPQFKIGDGANDWNSLPYFADGFNELTSSNFGDFTTALTPKTSPTTSDSLIISDNSDSGDAKRITLQVLRGLYKTYFDTIYMTASAVATQITTALSTYVAKTSWIDVSSTVTVTGFSGTPTVSVRYKIVDNMAIIMYNVDGTSNASNFVIDNFPFTANASQVINYINVIVTNNGTILTSPGRAGFAAATSQLVIERNPAGATFSSSGTKASNGQIIVML